ncbi:MAG: hypothetical protein KBH06_07250 [Spirochaetes bacterium]|nr:hypothetical protein [Spirochaetota bacterium]
MSRRLWFVIIIIALLLIESVFIAYWTLFSDILSFSGIPSLIYIFFPVVYAVISFEKRKYYFVSFITFGLSIVLSFARDGMSTFRTNPDSSYFGWFILFIIARLIVQLGCIFIGIIYSLIKSSRTNFVRKREKC